MSLADSILVAVEALVANKMRAMLTMLGIVIGVGAVIALMAVGQGSQKAVTDRIQGLGSNLLFVRPGSQSSGGVSGGQGSAQTLTLEDSNAIAFEVPQVVAVSPEVRAAVQVIAGGQNTFTPVLGVTPAYFEVLNLSLDDGELISDADIEQRSRVVVLGAAVATRLYGNAVPVGDQIRLSIGRNVITGRIAGVLARKGGSAAASQDNQIYLPISTVQTQIQAARGVRNTSIVNQITVQVSDKGQINAAKLGIDRVLSERHQVATPDYVIESQEDIQAAINEVSQTMTVLLGSIAGISLVVGGIGIMNIMLVSVTERTREIGIRKAVGARRSDILMQFLTEALVVTVLGGVIGIATGIGTAQFLNGRDIAGLGNNVQTVISWTSVIVAFAVSAAIGIFFGLYPAQRAASLRPIEALRYE
jgi:putative ABC transport system permease protein